MSNITNTTTNSNITIVEYAPKYAAGVAEMWNNTNEGWNGEDFSTTTEKVLAKEAASVHTNLFLAVDSQTLNNPEPKIVGYCKLTKDHLDENALYIDHLSVLPTYFNQKVGKQLVLESVNKTIELKYPRLYLYTWSGNTRAVPLYKKCGFFWEKGGDIHLVNHIPSVLACEAVADFFKKSCWYDHSKRPIVIEPDGREENKLEYFTYQWENEGKSLSMEYCRKGKGLSKIECDDYLIRAILPHRDLVFGKKHQVSYEIINKSGKLLEVEVEGQDHKNISFNYSAKTVVKDRELLSADFLVKPISEEQHSLREHPLVSANIKINGKLAEFRTGIVPKYPINLYIIYGTPFAYQDAAHKLYLNLENFCNEECEVSFNLTSGEKITFINPDISLTLPALAKKSLTVDCIINSGSLYRKMLEVMVKLKSGEEIKFEKEVWTRVYTHSGDHFDQTKEMFEANIGKFSFNIFKKDCGCDIIFIDRERNTNNIKHFPPKFGLPYSDEFDKLETSNIQYQKESNSLLLSADYKSGEFAGMNLTVYYRLHSSGIMEKWLKFTNNSQVRDNLSYLDRFDFSYTNLTIPYGDKLIKLQRGIDNSFDLFDENKISENWLFAGDEDFTAGVTWPREYKLKLMSWHFAIEHDLSSLKEGETLETKPVTFFLNSFNLERFRRFVDKKSRVNDCKTVKSSEVMINGGNPFTKEQVKVELENYTVQPLQAKLTVTSPNKLFHKQEISTTKEDNLFNLALDIKLKQQRLIEKLDYSVRYMGQKINCRKQLFMVGDKKINLQEQMEQDKRVLSVDNGVISFKTSPDFAPTLHSLVYNGREWADSSFPKTISKAWWTPWYGGISFGLEGINEKQILEEQLSAEFVTLVDNFKQEWQGIKIVVQVVKHEWYKGICYEQFFLTRAQTPVMVNFCRVINRSGKFINTTCGKLNFYKGSEHIDNNYWLYYNNENELCQYYTSHEWTEIPVDYQPTHALASEEISDMLLFLHGKKLPYIAVCSTSENSLKVVDEDIILEDDESFVTDSEFMIFTDKWMDYKELEDLRNIRFEV